MKFSISKAQQFSCDKLYKHTKGLRDVAGQLEAPRNAESRSQQLQWTGHLFSTLGYFSTLMNNKLIYEMGTRFGFSALALSYNETNTVISYDIKDRQQSLIVRDNLTFKIENLFDEDKKHKMLEPDLFFIDIAPHNGKDEQDIVDYLVANDYKGITLWHDIYMGKQNLANKKTTMWTWWTGMVEKHGAIDLTKATNKDTAPGLGMIDFSETVEVIE